MKNFKLYLISVIAVLALGSISAYAQTHVKVTGVVTSSVTASVSSGAEQFILVGTECLGYRDHIPGFHRGYEYEALPGDTFVVDYVRVFDKVK